jgi:type II secretory pathway component PulF
MEYFPLAVQEEAGKGLQTEISLKAFERVKSRDICNFTRQVSNLLRSGLPLSRALGVLQDQTENAKFREVIRSLKGSVAGGNTFAEALAEHAKIFPPLYTNMVHAGEVSGSLDTVMERLAEFEEKELDTRNKIISAMAYPAIMVVVGSGVIIVLLTFVIPRFTVMFQQMDQQLPAITQFLVAVSAFLKSYWYLLFGGLAGGIFLYRKYRSTPEGRKHVDTLKLKIPLIKDFLQKREITKFSRTMGRCWATAYPF